MNPGYGIWRALLAAAVLSAAWIGINSSKPVHTDDPFFIYWARAISPLPGDRPMKYFNWLRYEEKMPEETGHAQPGWAMVLSAVRRVAGERELVLHWLQWPFATMFLLGVFLLAGTIGAPPWATMMVCGSSPLFLLPASGMLGDLPALGLAMLGLAWWHRGPSWAGKIGGALLLALAGQMKVSVLVLYPLLLLGPGGGVSRLPGEWALALASFVAAGTYPRVPPGGAENTLITGNLAWLFQNFANPGLFFMKASYLLAACGSLVIPVVPYALAVLYRPARQGAWERTRNLLMGALAIPLLSLAGFWKAQSVAGGLWQKDSGAGAHFDVVPPTLNTAVFYLVIALFLAWGIGAVKTLGEERSGGGAGIGTGIKAWLAGWFLLAAGGFVVATEFPAGRHLMPLFPALAMFFLVDIRGNCGGRVYRMAVLTAVGGNLWLGASMARSDYNFARFSVLASARGAESAANERMPLVTTGSWGLRYYTEKNGGRILESASENLPQGAVMLVPRLTDRRVLPAALRKRSRELWVMTNPAPGYWPPLLPVATIPPVQALGAFHGGYVWFPFAFTRLPTESVRALEISPLSRGR